MNGEGFAFFRWMVDVAIPNGNCLRDVAGWTCAYCRRDWDELQGRKHGV